MDYQLVAIKVGHREDTATQVQEILTDFGSHILVRLGLHDIPEKASSTIGLILLQVSATDEELSVFLAKLDKLDGVKVKSFTL